MKIKAQLDRGLAGFIVIFLLLTTIVIVMAVFSQNMRNEGRILTYQDCINALGSRIQETFPSVCVTDDGLRFVNPDEQITCFRKESVNPDTCR